MTLMARMPSVAAGVYRIRYEKGDLIPWTPGLDWGANYAKMLGLPDPTGTLPELMRLYLNFHSDHEGGNVSANTCHTVGSSLSDVYYSVSAGLNGLAGPLHGLANQECLKWILETMEKFGGAPTEDQLTDFAFETLRAGKKVFSAGVGVVASERPLTIIAAHVVFEVEINVEDFRGAVESVALDAMQATLANGTVIQLDEDTKIRFEEGDRVRLPSLEAVAVALRAGEQVFARGEGEVILETDRSLTIRAFHVLFEREVAVEDFAGLVTSVNLEAHTATLENGTVVRIDDRTRIKHEDGVKYLLPSLAAVAEALRLDKAVFAAGEGQVEIADDGSPQILAFHIIFEVESVVEEFSGLVESVSLDAHTATFINGVVVRIGDRTKFRHEEGSLYTLGSLAAVAEALRAGDAVFAAGYGEVESAADGTPIILALYVVFELDITVEEFEAAVESVNLDAGTFTLTGGLVVKITDRTSISADGDLKTLGGVAEARAAGEIVIAIGKGRVVVENDASFIKASHVLFKIAAN